MSDFDQIAAYVSCQACRASNSVLVDMTIDGVQMLGCITLKVLKSCVCGTGVPEGAIITYANDMGVQMPGDGEDE